jgi:hypothetical protein
MWVESKNDIDCDREVATGVLMISSNFLASLFVTAQGGVITIILADYDFATFTKLGVSA